MLSNPILDIICSYMHFYKCKKYHKVLQLDPGYRISPGRLDSWLMKLSWFWLFFFFLFLCWWGLLHRHWGCNVYRRLFHKLVYFLCHQLTLISTRHRRRRRQDRHPSDFSPLIISFLWPMFLASWMQTAFCDFVTVIGHINLCSRTALAVAARLPRTGQRQAASAVATSCLMSTVRCPLSDVRCPMSRRIRDAQTANFLSPCAIQKLKIYMKAIRT